MTRFHVLWEHVEDKGDVLPLLKEDKKKGVFVDWGTFGNSKGFAIIDAADEQELSVLLSKYAEKGVIATSTETVISLDQVERNRAAK